MPDRRTCLTIVLNKDLPVKTARSAPMEAAEMNAKTIVSSTPVVPVAKNQGISGTIAPIPKETNEAEEA